MSSPYHPIRRRRPPDPVDAMLEQMREIKAGDRRKDESPAMSQLELMILMLKRP